MPDRQPFHHPRVRPDWLAKLTEEVLDPGQPIVDPHHHLWKARPDRYLLQDLMADLAGGRSNDDHGGSFGVWCYVDQIDI